MNPNIERKRAELATRIFDAGYHWRILFIGRSVNGSTDIVSCMSRSLRNLGHHVLDIDVKRHRTLFENPERAKGGNGPLYLQLGLMEPMLRRFRPQLIVCCAGGLTFREADAQTLKARGIVLVGLTLSDPDVFPTVHRHNHVFDFHTTNAMVAMDMYRAAGLGNTLYMPFGIDRGFVTQRVPPAPELAADVICIGHALNRPDRHKVMNRLAEQFNVRTYGRGWELPNSEVVEGQRMVQASRQGRIHVNFPLTRAGYINIKCGVFESVGSGALVCTGRFDEMADFFIYDNEIVGYEDEHDLARQLDQILRDPARYDAMTERAFDHLVGQHLYEHRWIKLFDDIRQAARDAPAWLGKARATHIRDTLAESAPRARKIILSGFYGAQNAGDELILRSISDALLHADPAVEVVVAAENPTRVEADHGLQSFVRRNHQEALQNVRTAAAVVVGGGGLWHDYTFARSGGLLGLFQGTQISMAGFGILPLLGRMFDLPYHLLGLGIGPLTDADAKRMAHFLAMHAESILVRDRESFDIATALTADQARLEQMPDTVYAVALEGAEVPAPLKVLRQDGRRLVGINLRPWGPVDSELLTPIAEAFAELAARERIALVGIPMQAGENFDSHMLESLAHLLPAGVPWVNLSAPLDHASLLGALGGLDLLVAMRLHACLLAHRLGIPTVGLAYDPKVSSHFAEIHRADFCLPLPLQAGSLSQAVCQAISQNGRLPEISRAAIEGLHQQAHMALQRAARRIATTSLARDVVYEVPLMVETNAGGQASASPIVTPAKPALQALFEAPALRQHGDIELTSEFARKAGSGQRLLANLPVSEPRVGDLLQLDSVLVLPGEGDVEVSLELRTPYLNTHNLGRLEYRLRIGADWLIVGDLAAPPVVNQLRLFGRGGSRVEVSLSVGCLRPTFPARTWARVTRVSLELLGAVAREHGSTLQVFDSAGLGRRNGGER
jgi:polysaccharide pyruvyl transferase CsaB